MTPKEFQSKAENYLDGIDSHNQLNNLTGTGMKKADMETLVEILRSAHHGYITDNPKQEQANSASTGGRNYGCGGGVGCGGQGHGRGGRNYGSGLRNGSDKSSDSTSGNTKVNERLCCNCNGKGHILKYCLSPHGAHWAHEAKSNKKPDDKLDSAAKPNTNTN